MYVVLAYIRVKLAAAPVQWSTVHPARQAAAETPRQGTGQAARDIR